MEPSVERNEPPRGQSLGSGRANSLQGSGVESSSHFSKRGSSMGIKFLCPNGHKLNVKTFLAGKKGVCPECRERFVIPLESIPKQRVASIGVASPSTTAAGTQGDEELDQDAGDEAPDVASASSSPAPQVAAAAQTSFAAPIASLPVAPTPPSPAPVVDPLDEAPNAQWYVRPPTGGQYGPARADLLRRWIGEGRVSADSLVWREGWADWKPAGTTLPALAAAVNGPSAGMIAPTPAMPQTTRAAGPAQMIGGAPAVASPSFLTGNPPTSSSTSAVATNASSAPTTRSTLVMPRKSTNMLPIVVGLALLAVIMLVALIWVIMSN